MKSTVFLMLWIFVMVGSVLAQHQKVIFREQVNLERGSYRGHSELQVSPATLVRGKKFSARIVFHNTGTSDYFFNPFFIGLIDLPAQLVIFNAQKEYIGNLLYWEGGSRRSRGPGDWTYIWGNGFVGTNIQRTAGYVPATQYGVMNNLLPPGTYYLQVIYLGVFLRPRLEAKQKTTDEWTAADREELFRSNIVKVELIGN